MEDLTIFLSHWMSRKWNIMETIWLIQLTNYNNNFNFLWQKKVLGYLSSKGKFSKNKKEKRNEVEKEKSKLKKKNFTQILDNDNWKKAFRPYLWPILFKFELNLIHQIIQTPADLHSRAISCLHNDTTKVLWKWNFRIFLLLKFLVLFGYFRNLPTQSQRMFGEEVNY